MTVGFSLAAVAAALGMVGLADPPNGRTIGWLRRSAAREVGYAVAAGTLLTGGVAGLLATLGS